MSETKPKFSARPRRVVIVGAGLAGMFTAARLAQAGHQVVVIDDGRPMAASRAAAGMFNVITGRFGALTWQAEALLSALRRFWEDADFEAVASFYRRMPIYRPFRDIEEYNLWQGRRSDPRYQSHFELRELTFGLLGLNDPLGGILIRSGGWCDIPGLLQALRLQLQQVFSVDFVSSLAEPEAEDLRRGEIRTLIGRYAFDHLMICAGAWAQAPVFGNAWPIIPNKGETLVLESSSEHIPFIVSRNGYLIPLEGGAYLAGSTYENQFDTLAPTEAGRQKILSHIGENVSLSFVVKEHGSGVRPTTPNRKPLIGPHPAFERVSVVGGFGTKGVLFAPWAAEQAVMFFESGNWDHVPEEAQAARFSARPA